MKEKPTPRKCPQCGLKLILKGPGWGFCDNCVAEIEVQDETTEREGKHTSLWVRASCEMGV